MFSLCMLSKTYIYVWLIGKKCLCVPDWSGSQVQLFLSQAAGKVKYASPTVEICLHHIFLLWSQHLTSTVGPEHCISAANWSL